VTAAVDRPGFTISQSVHALIREASKGRRESYFGRRPYRRAADVVGSRTRGPVRSAVALRHSIRLRSLSIPRRWRMPCGKDQCAIPRNRCPAGTSRHVVDDANVSKSLRGHGGIVREQFDHVVNALWDGRFPSMNPRAAPGSPLAASLKYGVSFRLPRSSNLPPSATFVSGPFGEVVSYADGLTYLTWYPVCLQAYRRTWPA